MALAKQALRPSGSPARAAKTALPAHAIELPGIMGVEAGGGWPGLPVSVQVRADSARHERDR